jgi:hypothetical protein
MGRPWIVHSNGTDLTLAPVAAINNDTYDSKGRTASPGEAWIDPTARQIRLYYFRLLGHQAAYAYNGDGI